MRRQRLCTAVFLLAFSLFSSALPACAAELTDPVWRQPPPGFHPFPLVQDFTSAWTFSCSAQDLRDSDIPGYVAKWFDGTDLEAALRIEVQETLAEGLGRIQQINPDLASEIVRRLSSQRFAVSCAQSGIGSDADTREWFWGSVRDIRVGKMFLWGLVFKSIEPNGMLAGAKGVLLSKIQDSKNVLFHELLHVAELDTLPHAEHNGYPDLPDDRKVRDAVYSCSEQAFPTPERLSENRLHAAKCAACALTRCADDHCFLDWLTPGAVQAAIRTCAAAGAERIQAALESENLTHPKFGEPGAAK